MYNYVESAKVGTMKSIDIDKYMNTM
jgi:hypothetical protein